MKEKLENVTISTLKWLRKLCFLALFTIIIFSITQFGKFSRDEEKLKDVYAISSVIPQGTIIYTTNNIQTDWTLVAYLSRIGYLSLDCRNAHDYFLVEKKDYIQGQFKDYDFVDLKLIKYTLLKRKH